MILRRNLVFLFFFGMKKDLCILCLLLQAKTETEKTGKTVASMTKREKKNHEPIIQQACHEQEESLLNF
jgi:hypothetical protein